VAGTVNQTLRHDGTTWAASSTLVNDGTNVGVGQPSPTEKLDVTGNVRASTGFLANDGSAGTPSVRFTNSPTTGIYRQAADAIGISTTGVERIRVTSGGNVGIGLTADPAEKLEVGGNIRLRRDAARNISVSTEPDNAADGKLLTIASGSAFNNSGGGNIRYGGNLVLQAGTGHLTNNTSGPDAAGGDIIIRSGSNHLTATGGDDVDGGDIIFEAGRATGNYAEVGRISQSGALRLNQLGGSGTRLLRTDNSGNVSISTIDPANVGTVTSVGLSLPAIFNVSGSPVTTSGTLTGALANQTANTIFAGPTTGGAAAPTFRALVAADIPNLDAAKITTGTLTIARGGTNSAATLNNNRVMVSVGGAIVENGALTANLPIYTDANGLPTTAVPSTGVQGYWTRTGTDLHNTTLTDNVGIGTNGPLARLDLKGSGNTNTSFGLGVRNSSDIYSLAVRDDGNVGIGTVAPLATLDVSGTGALKTPVGTSAERPSTPAAGMMRFNNTHARMEYYNGTSWKVLAQRVLMATGGAITEVGGYRIHTFTASGTFTAEGAANVEVLVVAGGGGGAGSPWGGGGGGGGGVIHHPTYPVTAGAITVTVGAGGAANTVGGDSFFGPMKAFGGGGACSNCGPGGSGGGTSHSSPGGSSNATTQTNNNGGTGYGNIGGSAVYSDPYWTGTGGGAGGPGGSGNSTGGVGRAFSTSGSSIYYAGGGGQVNNNGFITAGGTGGGGSGINGGNGQAGTVNTGGGGGGSRGGSGGTGGSGIVIVRYPIFE
jgi:hypothetical protein